MYAQTSAAYRPPELTTVPYPSSVDERVDVWSLGCSLFAMAAGRSPFESSRDGVQRLAILNARYAYPMVGGDSASGNSNGCALFSEEVRAMVDAMLRADMHERPFAKDVAAMAERRIISLVGRS